MYKQYHSLELEESILAGLWYVVNHDLIAIHKRPRSKLNGGECAVGETTKKPVPAIPIDGCDETSMGKILSLYVRYAHDSNIHVLESTCNASQITLDRLDAGGFSMSYSFHLRGNFYQRPVDAQSIYVLSGQA